MLRTYAPPARVATHDPAMAFSIARCMVAAASTCNLPRLCTCCPARFVGVTAAVRPQEATIIDHRGRICALPAYGEIYSVGRLKGHMRFSFVASYQVPRQKDS